MHRRAGRVRCSAGHGRLPRCGSGRRRRRRSDGANARTSLPAPTPAAPPRAARDRPPNWRRSANRSPAAAIPAAASAGERSASSGASMRRQVEREMGAARRSGREIRPGRAPAAPRSRHRRSRAASQPFPRPDNRLRLAAFDLDDEALRAPDRHEKALAIDHPGADPFGFAAAQPGPLEAGMRIEIRGSHPPRLTRVRRHRNRISVCALHKAGLNGESAMTSFSVVHRTMS